MKEFEKWAGSGFCYGKDLLNRPTLEAKRKGWKAALEWVLSRARIDENNYRYIEHNESENCIICDIYRELDKELLSEQSND